jgi:hypothetical protein
MKKKIPCQNSSYINEEENRKYRTVKLVPKGVIPLINFFNIFKVDKQANDEFKNINHIFNIICPSTAKTHSITYSQ